MPARIAFVCSIDGCSKPHKSRGFCSAHWARWQKYGSPLGLAPKRERISTPLIGSQGYLVRRVVRAGVSTVRCEHALIVERALGRPLKKPEEVHHFDEDKLNNAGNNLVVCPNRAYHLLLHRRTAALDANRNANWRRCPYCQQWDDPSNMYQTPGADTYRHRKCHTARERRRLNPL